MTTLAAPDSMRFLSCHVGVDHGIGIQEADPGFAATVGLSIRLQDSATHPEAPEDIGPLFVSPVHDLGLTVQLDGGWWEKPQKPSRQRGDQ